jgi:hypothetical protein
MVLVGAGPSRGRQSADQRAGDEEALVMAARPLAKRLVHVGPQRRPGCNHLQVTLINLLAARQRFNVGPLVVSTQPGEASTPLARWSSRGA